MHQLSVKKTTRIVPVSMEPRRSKRIFANQPARWENNKISKSSSWLSTFYSQDCKNRGVRMVKGNCVYRIESIQIIFIRCIIPMPCNYIIRRMCLFCDKVMVLVLVYNFKFNILVQILKSCFGI